MISIVCPAPPKVFVPCSNKVPSPDLMRPNVPAPSSIVPVRINPDVRFEAEALATAKFVGPVSVVVPTNSSP